MTRRIDALTEALEAQRRIAIDHVRRGVFGDDDLALLGITRLEAQRARQDGTYRIRSNKAQLWSAALVLTSFSPGNLAAATEVRNGHTRLLEPFSLGTVQLGDDGQHEMSVMVAHAIVNSSGAGNVRTDAEADVRRLLGQRRGDTDEVTVGFFPGLRPTPWDGGEWEGPDWMRRGLPR